MKILLTVHQFLPQYSAGTEVLTLETAKELRRLGYQVSILTGHPAQRALADHERFDRYEHEGIPITRFHHSYAPMGGQTNTTEAEYNNWLVAAFLRKFLRRDRPDVVHLFHLGRLSASVIDVVHELRIPMLLTPTDFWFVCPTNQLRLPDNSMCMGPSPSGVNCLRHLVSLNQTPAVQSRVAAMPDRLLELSLKLIDKGYLKKENLSEQVRALYRRPKFLRERMNQIDRVLVPTRLMETILKYNGLAAQRIVYCPYGINLSHIAARPQIVRPKVSIGFIGTLYEHKGVHILIRALRSIPDLPAELKIYGREDEFPAYVEQLKSLAANDPRIHLCGTFPNQNIGEVFAGLDVLVVPSIWYENTPLVIYSAQAAACPVIASNLGGMAEAVHHDLNGLLFEPGEAEALASLLRNICSDKSLLPRLSAKAIRPKSSAQYAADVEHLYAEILAQK